MFEDSLMEMELVGSAYAVSRAAVIRQGGENFLLAPNPPAAAAGEPPLPFGRPFTLSAAEDIGGKRRAWLTFDPLAVNRWHDTFHNNRTAVLTMDVVGANGVTTQEKVNVRLRCRVVPHAQPSALRQLAGAAVGLVVALLHFFQQLFAFTRGEQLDVERDATFAVDGPKGVEKGLQG